jgi:hypothetical protein
MSFNVFQNSTKSIPKRDAQIVRVTMEENEIGGRKTALPKNDTGATEMGIRHVSTVGR